MGCTIVLIPSKCIVLVPTDNLHLVCNYDFSQGVVLLGDTKAGRVGKTRKCSCQDHLPGMKILKMTLIPMINEWPRFRFSV